MMINIFFLDILHAIMHSSTKKYIYIINTIQDTNEVFYNPIVKLDKCIKIILQSSMARGKKINKHYKLFEY
jgi:hypothetical protein